MNLLEPWILLRLVAGAVAALLFVRAATTSARVLRHFDAARASEGQLALERRAELAATFVRVGAVVQVLALLVGVLGADRLSRGVRGAMCAYGVFDASPWGARSLVASVAVALAAGVLGQVAAFDARLPTLRLARPLAWATVALAPLSLVDLGLVWAFLGRVDLSVVASCCSVGLDEPAAEAGAAVGGPRVAASALALSLVAAGIVTALVAARRPTGPRAWLAGAVSLLGLPFAIAAAVLEVAPHVFETPTHVCPFCLFKRDAAFLGYPIFGAMFLAVVWGLGAAASGAFARGAAAEFGAFARPRLRRVAVAWAVALALGVAPVVRWAFVGGGASLFP